MVYLIALLRSYHGDFFIKTDGRVGAGQVSLGHPTTGWASEILHQFIGGRHPTILLGLK